LGSWTVPSVYDGNWHHMKLTYDTGSDEYILYIDGISYGDLAGTEDAITISTHRLEIGCNGGTEQVMGVIDEFKVYSPLSGAIDDLAQGGDTSDSDEYLFDEDNDYTLDFDTVDAQGRGEYMFLGSDSMFSGINVDLETNGSTDSGSLNLDWEYWDGDSWADLESITGFADTTNHFTTDGHVHWDENPTNWRPYSVNGSTDLYCIRTSLNNSSSEYGTDPVENFIKSDTLILQYLSSVTADNQTLVVVPERLWVFLILAPVLRLLLKKKRRRRRRRKFLRFLR